MIHWSLVCTTCGMWRSPNCLVTLAGDVARTSDCFVVCRNAHAHAPLSEGLLQAATLLESRQLAGVMDLKRAMHVKV